MYSRRDTLKEGSYPTFALRNLPDWSRPSLLVPRPIAAALRLTTSAKTRR